MGLDREGYVSGLLEQLTARQGEVALHGIGLAILAMSSPLLTIEARRAGRRFTQTYSWGRADGPVRSEPADEATGTRVAFSLSSESPGLTKLRSSSRFKSGGPLIRTCDLKSG